MKRSEHYLKSCLSRINEKFQLTNNDLLKIENLKDVEILSIAYTESGGFKKANGEFHTEENTNSYKVRIKYKITGVTEEKLMLLMRCEALNQ